MTAKFHHLPFRILSGIALGCVVLWLFYLRGHGHDDKMEESTVAPDQWGMESDLELDLESMSEESSLVKFKLHTDRKPPGLRQETEFGNAPIQGD